MRDLTLGVPRGMIGAAVMMCLAGWAPAQTTTNRQMDTSQRPEIGPTGLGEGVDRDLAPVRAATVTFKSLDKAVAAGYGRDGGRCVDNPPQGAMGFHH